MSILSEKNNDLKLRLQIVGYDPGIDVIEKMINKYDTRENVDITSIVEHDEIPEHILGFDISLQPSVVPYASPLMIFEYHAAGCAIIAQNQDNIKEILIDNVDAILFESSNEQSLETTLKKLCTDNELRNYISLNARMSINQKGFTWKNNAR